jgi:hypothetical protein
VVNTGSSCSVRPRQSRILCAGSAIRRGVHIFNFNVDGANIFAVARNRVALSEIVDIVRRLLAANARDAFELTLMNAGDSEEALFNAPS